MLKKIIKNILLKLKARQHKRIIEKMNKLSKGGSYYISNEDFKKLSDNIK